MSCVFDLIYALLCFLLVYLSPRFVPGHFWRYRRHHWCRHHRHHHRCRSYWRYRRFLEENEDATEDNADDTTAMVEEDLSDDLADDMTNADEAADESADDAALLETASRRSMLIL